MERDSMFVATDPSSHLRPDLKATLQSAQPMLYDLQNDPTEEHDIASDHPELVNARRVKLDAYWTPKIAMP
jgi:hypothetical protein